MSDIFGSGGARAEAAKQAATARRDTQSANEEAGRARQKAERGGVKSRGRDMLIGNLSSKLKTVLGG